MKISKVLGSFRSECGFSGNNGPRSRGIAFFRGGVGGLGHGAAEPLAADGGQLAVDCSLWSTSSNKCYFLCQPDQQLGTDCWQQHEHQGS